MNSPHYFCTLFDSNYLSRGLALYESLTRNLPNSKLIVLAFDELAFQVLKELNFPNLIVINLDEFEDEELLELKKSRSRVEYCWTCTPSLISYCLKKYSLESCTYVDADIYFFNSPLPLLEELGNDYSVSITEHRYTPEYDQSSTSGIYCVQFLTFKNDESGKEILEWWRQKCNEWCFNRFENGKFGDQKYLDDWTTRFKRVRVIQHLGCGIAPWNIQQYKINENFSVQLNNQEEKIIFFHFHSLKFFKNFIQLTTYKTSEESVKVIYTSYLDTLEKINSSLTRFKHDFNGSNFITSKEKIKMFIRSTLFGTPILQKRVKA